MSLALLMWLSNPIPWTIAIMLISAGLRIFRRAKRKVDDPSRIVHVGNRYAGALAAALMFLSAAYRPGIEFVAKAAIREQQDADDDEQGGPDLPRRHFLRQLRRVRRGEKLERLILRLE
jgi:hypothetical protein